MSDHRLAIGLIIVQQLLFAIDTAAIHCVGSDVSLMQIGFLRSLGSMALVLCLAPSIGWSVFHTQHPYLQALRALVTVGYAWVLIAAFAYIPFGDATAITYMSGLYVVVLASLLLGENVGLARYIAVATGIAGALLISKPGMSQLSLLYLAVLVGTVLNSLAVILTKYLRRDDSATTILLYVSIAQLVVFSPAVLEPWHVASSLMPWTIAMIVTGPLGMLCGIVALNYADASVLAPYSYVRLVLATLAAVVVFYEPPDALALAGSIVIVAACWYATRTIPRDQEGNYSHRTLLGRVNPLHHGR